jgi:hypothetical protein
MNNKGEFIKQWKEQFPSDAVPELVSLGENKCSEETVLEEISNHLYERDRLKKELSKEEFIIQFLKNTLNYNELKPDSDNQLVHSEAAIESDRLSVDDSIDDSHKDRKSSNSSAASMEVMISDNVVRRLEKGPHTCPERTQHERTSRSLQSGGFNSKCQQRS